MTKTATLTDWTTELRSGRWPQTAGALGRLDRDPSDGTTCVGGLCCLGVLALIEDRPWFWAAPTTGAIRFEGDSGGLLGPDELGGIAVQRIFSGLNDAGVSFAKIADLAELILTEDLELKPGLVLDTLQDVIDRVTDGDLDSVRRYVEEAAT